MNRAQILVVEDDNIVVMELRDRLQSLGYNVAGVASSGQGAVDKAAIAQPDLVLMDIRLKGDMDGIQAAGKILEHLDIPVIYLTAYADEDTMQRAKPTRPYGYLIKPFEERELYTTIEIALYKHGVEKKLRENERWLATLFRSISDGVISTNAAGIIKSMNPVAEKLTGWTQAEALGHDLDEVFHFLKEDTEQTAECLVAPVVQSGSQLALSPQTRCVARDGSTVPVTGSLGPILDDQGIMIGLVLAFQDVSVQRHLEQELLKAQKLESLGILAGGIAHDFNNILTIVLGNISLAQSYVEPESELADVLAALEKATVRAEQLTQRLLSFARGGAAVREPTAIGPLIKDSVGLGLSGSNVRGEIVIAEDLPPVEIDPGQIAQVINNLTINAVEAMREGGTLRVYAQAVTVQPEDGLSVAPGQYVRLDIADEGTGIPPECLPKIFDPFFTTKASGSGLGLAICYSVVQEHEGCITVQSQVGAGTTFSVYLPVSERPVPARTASKGQRFSWQGAGKVLLMDDEPQIREVAGRMLRRLGYRVRFASEGAEAIVLYRQALKEDEPFDAVILDLTIPGGMGGIEVVQELHKLNPSVKAIACSGYATDPVIARFQEYGFRGAVAKPYQVEELGRALQVVLG